IIAAAVLAIIGIFCKRVQLLVGGFQMPNLDYASAISGPALTDVGAAAQGIMPAMVYFPTPLEFGIMLGVFGLGVLLLLLGLRYLPLAPSPKSH
ncbi:MAG: polysulfide reductase, partial [Raoultibacter sp.]